MKVLIAFCCCAIGVLTGLPASALNMSTADNGIIDDSAPGWIWSGMTEYDGDTLTGGTGHAGGPGSFGAYTFKGTRFRLFCRLPISIEVDGRVHKGGHVKLSLDGNAINVKQATTPGDDDVCVADVDGLADGNNVLQVSTDAGWIVVEYLRLDASKAIQTDAVAAKIVSTIHEGVYRIHPRLNDTRLLGSFDGKSVFTLGAAGARYGTMKLTAVATDVYKLSPTVDESLALTVMNGSAAGVYALGMTPVRDNPAQCWYVTRDAEGYFRIACASQPDYVLDVSGDLTDIGAGVIVYKSHGGGNQQWIL